MSVFMLAAEGADIIANGAKNFFNSGGIDSVMNFFSYSQAHKHRDQRDNAKQAFEQAKQPFDNRSIAINAKKHDGPIAKGSLTRFSAIFMNPIVDKIDKVSQEEANMEQSNQTTAFTEFQPEWHGSGDTGDVGTAMLQANP